MDYEKIIDGIWDLSYKNIISREKAIGFIDDIINSPNYGEYIGDVVQKSIDDFFNMKAVGFLDDVVPTKITEKGTLNLIYNDSSGKDQVCMVGEILGIPVCKEEKVIITDKGVITMDDFVKLINGFKEE